MIGLDVRLAWSPPGSPDAFRIDVAFGVGAEFGVIFGASGAGKSSILRLIADLERPDSGCIQLGDEILFDAETKRSIPMRRRRIGMIFQEARLFPHLDVARNIGFGLRGTSKADAAARVDEVARLCGVADLLSRRVDSLSGGERQRVGLARALAPRPRLLLCDEPVSALDLAAREALIGRLKAVQRSEAIPVLYVTHSPDEAIALGSRLFLIEAGRLIDQGPPLDVLARSRSPSLRLGGVSNRAVGVVVAATSGAAVVELDGGPTLVVAIGDEPAAVGDRLTIAIRSDDVLLASAAVAGISARNQVSAVVDRVLLRDDGAEVVLRTGDVLWTASVTRGAVEGMGLRPGICVYMIIKARSCRASMDVT